MRNQMLIAFKKIDQWLGKMRIMSLFDSEYSSSLTYIGKKSNLLNWIYPLVIIIQLQNKSSKSTRFLNRSMKITISNIICTIRKGQV